MKYYVIAIRKTSDYVPDIQHLFGPWTEIEKADEKIAKLSYNSYYSKVELARVLEDEDDPDWVGYDKHEEEEEDENCDRSV